SPSSPGLPRARVILHGRAETLSTPARAAAVRHLLPRRGARAPRRAPGALAAGAPLLLPARRAGVPGRDALRRRRAAAPAGRAGPLPAAGVGSLAPAEEPSR